MAVPERLRAKVGKREIKISLGTSDPGEAKLRQAQEQARWRARFRDLDREIEEEATARAPEIVDSFLEAMARRNGTVANVIFGLQTVITMRLFIAWGRDDFADRRADRAFAFMPGRNAWRGADFTAIANVIPAEERDRLLARIDLFHRHQDTQGAGFAEAIAYLLRAQAWDVVRIEIMMIEDHAGIEIVRGSTLFTAVAEQLLRRLAATRPESDQLLQRLGEEAETPLQWLAPPPPPPVEAKTTKASRKGARPLSTGLAQWIELRKPSRRVTPPATSRAVLLGAGPRLTGDLGSSAEWPAMFLICASQRASSASLRRRPAARSIWSAAALMEVFIV
jgi:hypothetical protein